MTEVAPSNPHSLTKISVVGVGQVGMAAAFSIMQQVSITIGIFVWKHYYI